MNLHVIEYKISLLLVVNDILHNVHATAERRTALERAVLQCGGPV